MKGMAPITKSISLYFSRKVIILTMFIVSATRVSKVPLKLC